jgi:hypothetical protein
MPIGNEFESLIETKLFFHGDGGNGKTLLVRFFKEKCCKHLSEENWEYVKGLSDGDFIPNFVEAQGHAVVPSSLVDFGMEPRGDYRPKEAFSALMKMRRDLSGSGLRFPLYDFACALYLYKTGRLTPERQIELLPTEEMDFVREAIGLMKEVPGIGFAKAVFRLLSKHLSEKFTLYMSSRRIDEQLIQEMKSMEPEADLYPLFPLLQ